MTIAGSLISLEMLFVGTGESGMGFLFLFGGSYSVLAHQIEEILLERINGNAAFDRTSNSLCYAEGEAEALHYY